LFGALVLYIVTSTVHGLVSFLSFFCLFLNIKRKLYLTTTCMNLDKIKSTAPLGPVGGALLCLGSLQIPTPPHSAQRPAHR
jgi:hypothetical protein